MDRLLSRRAGFALCGLAALGAVATFSAASAQDFPSRPVRMIVPQAAGGGTDVFARALGQRLSERWGQPVIIDNRAGAAGVIGTGAVAKSAHIMGGEYMSGGANLGPALTFGYIAGEHLAAV